MLSARWGRFASYVLVLSSSFLAAMIAGYTPLGKQVDDDAYDWMFRLHRPAPQPTESALLEIDDPSFMKLGGVLGLRLMLADALERLATVSPKAVVVDLTLAEDGDQAADQRLETAMSRTHNLVLAAEMLPRGGGWQDPVPRFARWAEAVGHVHAALEDGVNRQVPLEKAAGRQRRWALSLEAYRLSRGAPAVVESPSDLHVGEVLIPARRDDARAIYVRRLAGGAEGSTGIPRLSILQLRESPGAVEAFGGKVVFIGVTAQSATRDRLLTPYSSLLPMPGVEIHANAFETLAAGRFVTPAGNLEVAAVCALLTALAGAVFAVFAGWTAYTLGALLLLTISALPYLLFVRDIVFPFTAPTLTAWLSVAGAASFQHFVARRQLRRAESEKSRYQQAVHFVTHEMRTPLTAIQGSSELMTRYNLNDEKRKQIADLIHAESRRLARMIETFLSVERLSAGEMELKREPVLAAEVVSACVMRAQPLADRKRIRLQSAAVEPATMIGDRELLEYAFYNLLTNAIKYSPAETEVTVAGRRDNGRLRLSVRDQGIGMDKNEVRDVFRRFYRTRRAVASGEAGTGIGLSIV
ncbi:MAG TPA: CHASE2 domain-containing protein, partial [Bryobacteraceae bacterium]|nr:CHASE2 domain-containing protein [Bryobacteraceae bacterium]